MQLNGMRSNRNMNNTKSSMIPIHTSNGKFTTDVNLKISGAYYWCTNYRWQKSLRYCNQITWEKPRTHRKLIRKYWKAKKIEIIRGNYQCQRSQMQLCSINNYEKLIQIFDKPDQPYITEDINAKQNYEQKYARTKRHR